MGITAVLQGFHRHRSPVKLSAILLFPLALLYFVCVHQYTQFTDTAYFGGDTWEYQAMGVNLALGYGLNTWGQVAPFDSYMFGPTEPDASHKRTLQLRTIFAEAGRNGGNINTVRPPLYTIFLGAIYLVFGIHPLLVKNIQLFILALVAGALPLLGALWWKRSGMLTGLLSGIPFIALNFRFANFLLAESLFIGLLSALCISVGMYEQRPSPWRALITGAVFGLCVLTKVMLLLVLPIVIVLWWLSENNRRFRRGYVFLLAGCIAVILPWSLYANLRAGSPVLLSTQISGNMPFLLNAHNELTRIDGMPHSEWTKDPSSFYTSDASEGTSLSRVLRFYKRFPGLLVPNALSKLNASFTPVPFLVLIMLLCLAEGFLGALLRRRRIRFLALAGVIAAWWMYLPGTEVQSALQSVIRVHPGLVLVACTLIGFFLFLRRRHSVRLLPLPTMMTALLLSFAVMMMIAVPDNGVYPSRYTKTMEFLCILVALQMVSCWIRPRMPVPGISSNSQRYPSICQARFS